MPAVSYILTIDGTPASPELLGNLQQIEVEDNASLPGMVRLRFAMGLQPDSSDWRLLADDLFQRLTKLRVSVTVGSGNAEPLIDAYVIDNSAEFSNDPGASLFEVVGMDASVLMNLEEKIRSWPNSADSDIAETLFGEHGLTPDVETTQPSRQEADVTPIQRGTDLQFLRQLAERNGFECYVEANPTSGVSEGHFHPPRVDTPPQGVLSVRLGADTNVNAFNAHYNMVQPAAARAAGLGAEDQSDQTAEVESSSLIALGGKETKAADKPRVVWLSQTGLSQTGELQTLAQAAVDRSSWAILATGELNTAAYAGILRAKRPVNVRGAGQRFSGTYYVEKVLHKIVGDSYTQRFALKRNALDLIGKESFKEDKALA